MIKKDNRFTNQIRDYKSKLTRSENAQKWVARPTIDIVQTH